jgi:hypothetical protein
MVESDIVWGIIYAVGPNVVTLQTPQRPFPSDVCQQKVLDIAIDEVSGALSMHVVPPTIRIVCGTRTSDSPIWLHYSPLCGFIAVL